MNQYKIDYNAYAADSCPYALYARGQWGLKWRHIQSFRTIEEAKAAHAKIAMLPIYLDARMTTNHAVGIKEMTDPLVARLRSGFVTETEMREAADEIERLRRLLDRDRLYDIIANRWLGYPNESDMLYERRLTRYVITPERA
jgi:hypothetical protein